VPRNEKQRQDVEEKVRNGNNSWLPYYNSYMPTAKEVNEWAAQSVVGHDSINMSVLIKTRAERKGINPIYCVNCKGEGSIENLDNEAVSRYDSWKPREPPAGHGWQLWETVSEGSPISPVFSTPENLAEWCEGNATIGARDKLTRGRWLELILAEGGVERGSMIVVVNSGLVRYFGSDANLPQGKKPEDLR